MAAFAAAVALCALSIRGFFDANERLEHTLAVRAGVALVLRTLLDAETGQRGFVITGDEAYLEPWSRGRAQLPASLESLRKLTADDPSQQALLARVEANAALKLDEMAAILAVRRQQGEEAAAAMIRTNRGKRAMDLLRADLATMDSEEVHLFAQRKLEQQRNALLSLLALALSSGLFGFLLLRQAAARRTAEATSKTAAAENEVLRERQRTAEFQERFVAILGHDLRNPLASLGAGIALLKAGKPERIAGVAARMDSSVARMSAMVDQLLDLARARLGGGIPVAPAPADLGAVVSRIVEELRASNPGRELSVTAAGPLAGTWDAARLEQVVSNLVGNALSHGAPGSPVQVSATGNDGVVTLAVHNRGKSIPPALQQVLFEPFRRGDREATGKGASGLGLGLYISREIVRAHGGTIEVASGDAEGTTFTVRLPRTPRQGGLA